MMPAKQQEYFTAGEWKQHVQDEIHWANRTNDRVRLAKRILIAAGEPDLVDLVPEETEESSAYEDPQADQLSTIGPGSTVEVCRYESWGGGRYLCYRVFVTHRSGDELRGIMDSRLFEGREKITFDLKHVCYVEDEG